MPAPDDGTAPDTLPTWRGLREAVRVMTFRPHLVRTVVTAVVVGTLLFAINHLDTVLKGEATTETWIKIGVTYLVPFAVSNAGVLVATHRRPPRPRGTLRA